MAPGVASSPACPVPSCSPLTPRFFTRSQDMLESNVEGVNNFFSFHKISNMLRRSPWVAQSVERPTPAFSSGRDLRC